MRGNTRIARGIATLAVAASLVGPIGSRVAHAVPTLNGSVMVSSALLLTDPTTFVFVNQNHCSSTKLNGTIELNHMTAGIEVITGLAGAPAKLTWTSISMPHMPLAARLQFLSASCSIVSSIPWKIGITPTGQYMYGTVPATAKWIVVNGFLWAGAIINYSIVGT